MPNNLKSAIAGNGRGAISGDVIYIKAELSATITPDEAGGYVARCAALDVSSDGETIAEAKSNIKEAVEMVIEYYVEQGILAEVLDECGFRRIGQTPFRRARKISRAMPAGMQIRIPAELPVAYL